MTTTQTTDHVLAIYGPNDERWAPLQAWFDEHADELLNGDGKPLATMESLWPSERAIWHARQVLGLKSLSLGDIAHPPFPADVQGPDWATESTRGEIATDSEMPVVSWAATLIKSDAVTVYRTRTDTFDPDAQQITEGAELALAVVGGEIVEMTPAGLREIAAGLLTAAEKLEA